MKKLFKKVLIASGIASCMASGVAVSATFNDPLNTLQNSFTNLQDVEHRIAEELENQAQRMLEKELSKLGLESEAATAAQEVIAEQRLAENLRNSEVARQQEPLFDICQDSGQISFTMSTDMECYRDSIIDEVITEAKDSRPNGNDTPEEKEEKIQSYTANRIFNCEVMLTNTDSDVTGDYADASESKCYDPRFLIDSYQTTVPTGKDLEAAKQAIAVLAQPTVEEAPAAADSFNTKYGREAHLQHQRKQMMKDIVLNVYSENLKMTMPSKFADAEKTDPLPSLLQSLEDFDNNRYGDPEFLLKIGAAHADKSNTDVDVAKASTYNIEQVQREMAVMDSFLVHMAVLQYKSQLRMETIQASLLGLETTPLDK